MKVAVILPAYNEELTLAATIADFATHLPEATIVVVNNNSSDKTEQIALSALKQLGSRGVYLFEVLQGKSNAVRKAFQHIDAEFYVMSDADQTYPAAEASKLIDAAQQKQIDMVVGDRLSGGHYYHENKRLFHNFGNDLVRTLINRLFRSKIKDVMSGYRVFNRKFVKHFPITCQGFELETELTLFALTNHFSVMEMPIEYKDRPQGSFSKLNTYRDGMRVLMTILNIFKNYRPMTFFCSLAALSSLASLVLGSIVIQEYIEHQFIRRVPTAILATGLMLFAGLFLAIGLILSTVERFQRQTLQVLINKDDRGRGQT